MGVVGDTVVIPGTPLMSLPELLKQAEDEVFVPSGGSPLFVHRHDPFKTPLTSRTKPLSIKSTTPNQYPMGEREWAKDDWKLLDACFTDLRLELGNGSLADVTDINLGDVAFRFIELMGGRRTVNTFGNSWT